ncbi:major facilitator superfamily protein [Salmonella enterica subsp. enterica]|uniref:Major facilitator superfamily protein n=1 Tax=Salmonella enterica I TaxID=59201 RepID=A0A447N2Q2_SALET|nr:major facilitator superfamily protein [Salmonella enterica subsp. enterica]
MMSIEIEKPTTRGRWLHIIPATILVYIVAYMDRTNIAIGIAGGMDEDLGMTASLPVWSPGSSLLVISSCKFPAVR